MDSSQSLLKQHNSPNTLILVQGDPFHVSDLQNCKIINVYCFKLKKKKKKLHLELHYSDLINHVWAHVPVISQTFNMHPWKAPAGKYFPVEGNFKEWISNFPSMCFNRGIFSIYLLPHCFKSHSFQRVLKFSSAIEE